jgi:hypothetical protein
LRRDFLELDAVFFFGVEVLLEGLTLDFSAVLEADPVDLGLVEGVWGAACREVRANLTV